MKRSPDIVLYGGTHETVTKQLNCLHNWVGPSIDAISRYYKCEKCLAIWRDITEREFYKIVKGRGDILFPNSISFEEETDAQDIC
jgi:hypothetical protein